MQVCTPYSKTPTILTWIAFPSKIHLIFSFLFKTNIVDLSKNSKTALRVPLNIDEKLCRLMFLVMVIGPSGD